MQLSVDGAQHFPRCLSSDQLDKLEQRLAIVPPQRAGTRLKPLPGLPALVEPATRLVRAILGSEARPVRATLFDKTADRNWALGWHQDRTIAVRTRLLTPGFQDWTLKEGIDHVVPPHDLLARMLTLRLHLDPAGLGNAPLLIAPGSHRLGRLPEKAIPAAVDRLGIAACPADRGDIWLYATPILHASEAAAIPARRRVLQILYSADDLHGGLQWLGI